MNQKLEDIKRQTAVEHGWKNYETLIDAFKCGVISQYSFEDYLEDVVKIYAGED